MARLGLGLGFLEKIYEDLFSELLLFSLLTKAPVSSLQEILFFEIYSADEL